MALFMLHYLHDVSAFIPASTQHRRQQHGRCVDMNRTRRRGVVPNSGRLPRLNLASNPADDESSRTVGVVVKRSCRNPVDTAQVSAYGSVFYANGYSDGNSDGWVVMQTISGVVEGGGGEVIAVVPPGKYPSGSSVAVEARYLADKPPGLDWEHGAVLPFQVSELYILCLTGVPLLWQCRVKARACTAG